jgi:hypothetical protein
MVVVETGCDGVRREDDDHKENIGMLINYGNRKAATISENCYQPELNTCC